MILLWKIAFVGVTTPKTITSSTPKYFQDDEGNFIYGFMQDETGEKLYAARSVRSPALGGRFPGPYGQVLRCGEPL